jgi:hypothetical protein
MEYLDIRLARRVPGEWPDKIAKSKKAQKRRVAVYPDFNAFVDALLKVTSGQPTISSSTPHGLASIRRLAAGSDRAQMRSFRFHRPCAAPLHSFSGASLSQSFKHHVADSFASTAMPPLAPDRRAARDRAHRRTCD